MVIWDWWCKHWDHNFILNVISIYIFGNFYIKSKKKSYYICKEEELSNTIYSLAMEHFGININRVKLFQMTMLYTNKQQQIILVPTVCLLEFLLVCFGQTHVLGLYTLKIIWKLFYICFQHVTVWVLNDFLYRVYFNQEGKKWIPHVKYVIEIKKWRFNTLLQVYYTLGERKILFGV